MGITEIEISDINKYIEHIDKSSKDNNINLFRGQADVSWNLDASVFRGGYKDNKEKEIYELITKYNFNEFLNQNYYLDTLIQMQHYGVPTRLLDWSYNPLIALYFAVAYYDNCDAYVYQNTIDKELICSFNSDEYKILSKLFQLDVEQTVISPTKEDEIKIKEVIKKAVLNQKSSYFIDSVLSNDRIRSQQGCFSIKIDKKDKFIYFIMNELFSIYLREFLSNTENVKFDSKIYKIIEKNNNSNSRLLNILSKTYRNRENNYGEVVTKFLNDNSEETIEPTEEDISNKFQKFIAEKLKILEETTNQEFNNEKMFKYLIKKEDKSKIKLQLENIGITPTFIYPDIQGTIDHIKNKFN